MAKTLLRITQDILGVMSSDEINSITDSAEGEIVARIVMSTFDNMVSNKNWRHFRRLLKLESLSDSEKPTHLKLPDNVKELVLFNYNKQKVGETKLRYEEVKWKEPDEFLMYTNKRDSTAADVKIVTDPTGIKVLVKNDIHPTYFTSFDDETIICDSYLSSKDDTLHVDNVQAYGYIMPESSFSDSWIPDLPAEAMSSLIEEAKSTARFQVDDVSDVKAEQESGRQKRWLARKSWSVNGGIKYPNYGRKSRGSGRDVTFRQD